MRHTARSSFIAPFMLGTVVGAVGGVTLGALLGRHLITSFFHLASALDRDHDDGLRFDLLAQ
ncbi:MAG: hypothetical protein IRY97_00470 [Thermomicrobiaceae bacterium]|nr:hypothetical protein [Thermomicrobiaceae bacterium]